MKTRFKLWLINHFFYREADAIWQHGRDVGNGTAPWDPECERNWK